MGVLAALASASSLANRFAYDDMTIVVENERLAEANNARRIWMTDWWYSKPQDTEERHRDRLYRPLTMQTLAWNHALGDLQPFGYHVFNVAAHVAVSLLVWALTRVLFADAVMSFLSGALFAVHPIHTEAVANVVGRAEVLSALFVLLGLLCLGGDVRARRAAARWAWRAGMWLSLLAGLFSKEQAICLLALAPLCEWWLRRGGDVPGAGTWPASVGKRYLAFIPLVALYLLMRWAALEGHLTRDALPAALDNPLSQATLSERIFTPPAILTAYLRLMVWPADLCCDYSYRALPLADAPWRPTTAIGLSVILGAVVWAVRSWRRDGFGFFVVVAFACSYGLISNAVVVIGTIMGERLFYLPSVCVCWALVFGARTGLGRLAAIIGQEAAAVRYVPWVASGVLAVLTVRSAVRNLDWYDGPRLFAHDVRVNPDSARLQLFVAKSLLLEDRRDEAEEHVRRSLEIYPYLADSHRLMGWLRAQVGDWSRAEAEYKLALQLRWEYKEAQREYETYRRYFEKKDPAALDRIEEFEQAVATQPADARRWRELAALQFQAGSYRAAIRSWRRVLELDADDLEARFELATLLSIDEQYEEAARQFKIVVQNNPDDWRAHANLCMLLIGEDAEAAIEHARRAVRFNPDGLEAHINLATALLAVGRKAEGVRQLRLIRDGLPEGDPTRKVIEHRLEELR